MRRRWLPSYQQNDLAVAVDVTVAHSASSATIRFTSNVASSGAYRGVDDVVVDAGA